MNVRIALVGSYQSIGDTIVAFRQNGIPFIVYHRSYFDRLIVTSSKGIVDYWNDTRLLGDTECKVYIRERDYELARLASLVRMEVTEGSETVD